MSAGETAEVFAAVVAVPVAGAEDCDVGAAGALDVGAGFADGDLGFGAETPAMSEPSPSFCRVGASSLPFASMPFADWNFCTAATVFESHLPFGLP